MTRAVFDAKRPDLVKALIKHCFWGRNGCIDTRVYETPDNIAVVNRAIDIARQQLPRECLFDDRAVFQRCVTLFRADAFYWYARWC